MENANALDAPTINPLWTVYYFTIGLIKKFFVCLKKLGLY